MDSTAWGQALRDIDPDGGRSRELALRLFAIAFGPLPGVDAPTDRRGVRSASIAVRAIDAHRDELTPEQQTAVDAYLTTPADAVEITIQPVQAGTPPTVAQARIAMVGGRGAIVPGAAPEPAVVKAVTDAANGFRTQFAGLLGADVPGTITVTLTGVPGEDDDLGYARVQWKDGAYAGCRIELTSSAGSEAVLIVNTVAHEVFHCFQARDYQRADWGPAPDWVIEGGAEWAAATVAPSVFDEAGWWEEYLTKPELPLFTKTYDAMGFWAHLDASGTSPWSIFRAVFRAALDQPAAFAASGATSDAFLDTWASGFLRSRARGAAWDATGPGITDDNAMPVGLSVGKGAEVPVSAMPYTNALYQLTLTADVTQIVLLGHGRLSDGKVDIAGIDLVSRVFCTKQEDCKPECPDGSPLPTALPRLDGTNAVLAITGGEKGISGTLTGSSLEDFCKRPSKAVRVHLERPASSGVLPGTVLDIVSCTGPFGSWNGVMRLGGLSAGGFEVPFTDLPIAFTIQGRTAQTNVSGVVPTPVFDLDVEYDLNISVDPTGKRMTITGTGGGDNGMFTVSEAFGDALSNLPIEPAPPGRC